MAKRPSAQAQTLLEAERADRAENADINESIARTDSEVFTDAMGDEPLDDEAGTELEEMGEGLEGEELEDDQEQPEGAEVEAAPEGEEEAEEPEQGEPEGETAAESPPAEQRQMPPQPSIPPRVLRETRERARETENELRTQLRDMQMRIDSLTRQPPPQQMQSQPAPAAPAPDMFADPDGYRNWVLTEAEKRAQATIDARLVQMQQMQQRDIEMRLNDSLAQTASGPRSYEFNVAYRDLTSLERTPEHAALVRRIVAQPDPGQAILDWWEQTSDAAYIEHHRDQIRQTYGAMRPQRGGVQRQVGRVPLQNGQVRHEVRLPRSLSDAQGGRSQHTDDPEMFDGSEESVFAYGARR